MNWTFYAPVSDLQLTQQLEKVHQLASRKLWPYRNPFNGELPYMF